MSVKVKKLTKEEAEWIEKLKNILSECPSDRISSFTIGDNFMFLFDKRFDAEIQRLVDENGWDWCRAVEHLNADLDTVPLPFPLHSTAG